MKLKDYIKELQSLIDGDPSLSECEIVYAVDDEGNSYKYVGFTPSVIYGSDSTGSYIDTYDEESLTEDELEETTKFICVN